MSEIVMEFTGQYWRPVWNTLEGAFASGAGESAAWEGRSKKFPLELAWQGTFSDHQRGKWARLMRQMHFLEESIEEWTAQIESRIVPYENFAQRLG